MPQPDNSHAFGKAVCEFLGIPPELVSSVTVTDSVGEVLRIQVDLIAKKDIPHQEIVQRLAGDERNVSISWNRPIVQTTSLESKAVEYEGT